MHVTAITGSSGSGAAPSAGTHHPVRAVNLKTYKPLVHQHTPEIEQTLRDAGAADVRAALRAGVGAAHPRHLRERFVEVAGRGRPRTGWPRCTTTATAREPFVRRPPGRLPEVAAVSGSNYAEVGFAVGAPSGGRRTLTCFSAIDNLIKGGAGQAIQNMNLVLGLDERLSLEDPGSWP